MTANLDENLDIPIKNNSYVFAPSKIFFKEHMVLIKILIDEKDNK
jgi:hypothetical protein